MAEKDDFAFLDELKKIKVQDHFFTISAQDVTLKMRRLKALDRQVVSNSTMREVSGVNPDNLEGTFLTMLQFNEFCYSIVEVGGAPVGKMTSYITIDGEKHSVYDVIRENISNMDSEVYWALFIQYREAVGGKSDTSVDLTTTDVPLTPIADYQKDEEAIAQREEELIKEVNPTSVDDSIVLNKAAAAAQESSASQKFAPPESPTVRGPVPAHVASPRLRR